MANPFTSPYLRIGLLGLLIALAMLMLREPPGESDTSTIIVTGADLMNVRARFERTWQRGPTDTELRRVLEQYVRQEVLYREALARGYDRDDPSVRLAMQQKMEFLATSQLEQRPPTDEEVEAFFALRQEQYRVPAVLSFHQVYVNLDGEGDAASRAAEILEALREEDPGPDGVRDWGDRTMLDSSYASLTTDQVDRVFGTGFGQEVETAPVGAWSGPLRSGLGLHLVKVVEREESRIPEIGEVISRVINELQYEAGQAAREQLYQEIAQNYRVVLDSPVRAVFESDAE